MIQGSTDLCYSCGQPDHFANKCPLKQNMNFIKCFICKRDGHEYDECYATYDVEGSFISKKQKECCYRCGRIGHWVLKCDQDKDIFGRECHHFVDDVHDAMNVVSDIGKSVVNKTSDIGKGVVNKTADIGKKIIGWFS